MKVLGISSGYHDSSAALVVDGVAVASAAEERFTSIKHDPGFPEEAIRFCLKQAGIPAEELDQVAYYEDPHAKFTRKMATVFERFPGSRRDFVKASSEAVSSGFGLKNRISKLLDIEYGRIQFVPHHTSHAAHAFLTSGLKESAVMTVDAVGEWSSTTIHRAGSDSEGRLRIELIDAIGYPHSLGLLYSAFTSFLGFQANDGECSTMALAAFGRPIFVNEVKRIITLDADGSFQLDPSYLDLTREDGPPLTQKFMALLGQPRAPRRPYSFSGFGDGEPASAPSMDDQRYADVAASIQEVIERAVVSLARRAQSLTGSRHLCYGGGVALNCVANTRVLEAEIFDTVYIPPDPGDGGGAMGAALYASSQLEKAEWQASPRVSAFLGGAYPLEPIREMLPHLDPSRWHSQSRRRNAPLSRDGLEFLELSASELPAFVARELEAGKIVGWSQGRFENGPRALGHRSLLIRPDSVPLARRLSATVKAREEFRPYACSILEEDSSECLAETYGSQLGRWMQAALQIKDAYKSRLRAVCHVDGTTRAQICTEADDPRFHRLLIEFKKLTGLGALLNTSLNESGFPLASSPLDALLMYARTGMDLLVLDELIVRRRPT